MGAGYEGGEEEGWEGRYSAVDKNEEVMIGKNGKKMGGK